MGQGLSGMLLAPALLLLDLHVLLHQLSVISNDKWQQPADDF